MRLWHKDLISVLPRQQLISQWRECCCIAKNIAANGTPNHILVNRILKYPMAHFYSYGLLVIKEMKMRGYRCDKNKFIHYFTYPHETAIIPTVQIFLYWHDNRYLKQCFYNLQEKFDCGGITDEEWEIIIKNIRKDMLYDE